MMYDSDNTSSNRQEADLLYGVIHHYMAVKGMASMQQIYEDLSCNDIPMYLAVHDLVRDGVLSGPAPYVVSAQFHTDRVFKYVEPDA